MSAKKSESGRRHHVVPMWEWIVAGVGLTLLMAVVVFTGYRAYSEGDRPPVFAIEVESVVQSGEAFLATIRVTNSGDHTASALAIEGTLFQGDEEVEKSAATLTYSPARSTRSAAMIFMNDPRAYQLKVRPVGFEKP